MGAANTMAEPVPTRLRIMFPRLILTPISCRCLAPVPDSQHITLLSFLAPQDGRESRPGALQEVPRMSFSLTAGL
jgi:hypothetical protein